MQTICCKCKKILTDIFGNRMNNANFDSHLNKNKYLNKSDFKEKDITFAWCNTCYEKELKYID